MGAAAGFHGGESRRKPLEVADHLGSPKLATGNHHLALIDAVKLEDDLEVSIPIRRNIHHFLSSAVTPRAPSNREDERPSTSAHRMIGEDVSSALWRSRICLDKVSSLLSHH